MHKRIPSGISVPEKRQDEGQKKIRYGARQRKNKKKSESGDETSTAPLDDITTQDTSPTNPDQAADEVKSTGMTRACVDFGVVPH